MTSLLICPHRRTKASVSTRFLINLVSAMTLLNLTFLTNNFVADLKNSVGCKIMAALMHYFMLAMFTWFAVQAFHLCMQLYTGGKVVIRYYMLKVCIISWGESMSLFSAIQPHHGHDIWNSVAMFLLFQHYQVWLQLSCLLKENMVNRSSTWMTLRQTRACELGYNLGICVCIFNSHTILPLCPSLSDIFLCSKVLDNRHWRPLCCQHRILCIGFPLHFYDLHHHCVLALLSQENQCRQC